MLFRKKKINTKKNNEIYPKDEFKYAMEFVKQTLKHEKTYQDKIVILNYLLNVIKKDLQYDTLNTIIYSEEYFKKDINFLMPVEYYDKEGREQNLYRCKVQKYKDIDLSKDCVLVMPWHRHRLRGSIKNIFKNGFKYHESNHFAYYFTHIDICHAYNGNHSIASGVGHNEGVIKAEVIYISDLFDNVYTDGERWINTHSNEKLDKVFDFRLAIIYEISKIKFKLKDSL